MNAIDLIKECQNLGVSVYLSKTGVVKLSGNPDAVRDAADLLRSHRNEIISFLKTAQGQTQELLGRLQLDLVRAEIESGYPAEDLWRVNNIAYHLITAKGWEFDKAITAAAHWVNSNPPHASEAGFINVQSMAQGP